MTGCSAHGCTNRSEKTQIFPFPSKKHVERRKRWEIAVRRGDPADKGKLWQAGPGAGLCKVSQQIGEIN